MMKKSLTNGIEKATSKKRECHIHETRELTLKEPIRDLGGFKWL